MDNNLFKELRELTGAGISDIKQALDESSGNKDEAIAILRKKGQSKLNKKSERQAKEGLIDSYIHAGSRIGVLIELNSETDFVARTEDFKKLAHELAMHIASANPLYVSVTDVPAEVIAKEEEIYMAQARSEGKPEDIASKMVQGKTEKYYQEVCLMEQPFFRDPDKKVKDFISENISKMGENVVVRRFSRFQLGA